MRFGFFLPWWLLPVFIFVWIIFLPFRLLLALIVRPKRQRDEIRVRVRTQETQKTPPSHYG